MWYSFSGGLFVFLSFLLSFLKNHHLGEAVSISKHQANLGEDGMMGEGQVKNCQIMP